MSLNQMIYEYLVYYPLFFARGQNLPLHLRRYCASQHLSKPEIDAEQVRKLGGLLAYSKENVPYYARSFGGVKNAAIERLEDLGAFPFITKRDIKERIKEFESARTPRFRVKKTTGGSTGQPVTLWKTQASVIKELAATWRAYSWAGIRIGDKQARFWGVPFHAKDRLRARLIDLASNRRRFGAFHFDDDILGRYHREIQQFDPRYFYGYVSILMEYANFIQRHNLTVNPGLRSIITTSEVLTKHHRDVLETVFSTKVHNEYGCGEVGSIAHECEQGSMHVMSENVIVEIYDGERRCGPDEVGEVVVTELNNYAMPLIRYRLGDYACLSSRECACGRKLPVLGNIFGREYDTVKNREGKLFHGEFFMYMIEEAQKKGLGIQSFQVVQEDLDRFTIKIVPGSGYGRETEELITGRIRKDFDAGATVEYVVVGEIPREPSGKMRLIVGMQNRGARDTIN